jgi:hypothetical protein
VVVETFLENKTTLKTRLSLLLSLSNRVLTWDNCKRRPWQGPGRCILCKKDDEKLDHLLVTLQGGLGGSFKIDRWKRNLARKFLSYLFGELDKIPHGERTQGLIMHSLMGPLVE